MEERKGQERGKERRDGVRERMYENKLSDVLKTRAQFGWDLGGTR